LQLDGIARFWVRDGREITIERHPKATDDDVRTFLLGSPFVALLQQRGQLVLSGSVVQVGSSCMIFSGPSGVGKSTIAYGLSQRGFRCLSDDVCSISVGEDGTPQAVASYPLAELRMDSIERLRVDASGLRRVRPCLEKRAVPLVGAFCPERMPVKRLYWLCASRHTDGIELESMTDLSKLRVLRDSTYRLEFLRGQDLASRHFRQIAQIAPQLAVKNVLRPAGRFLLDQLADAIERDVRS
jgi:hypothetical protein